MRRRNWLVISTIALSLGMALVGASLPARAQQSGQLKVDPATQQIASGANFTVRIVQNAGVVTAGAQTDVTFNAGVVQVVDIKLGEKYSSARS